MANDDSLTRMDQLTTAAYHVMVQTLEGTIGALTLLKPQQIEGRVLAEARRYGVPPAILSRLYAVALEAVHNRIRETLALMATNPSYGEVLKAEEPGVPHPGRAGKS